MINPKYMGLSPSWKNDFILTFFLQGINLPNSDFKNSNNLFHMQDNIRTSTLLPDIFLL